MILKRWIKVGRGPLTPTNVTHKISIWDKIVGWMKSTILKTIFPLLNGLHRRWILSTLHIILNSFQDGIDKSLHLSGIDDLPGNGRGSCHG